MEESRPFTQSVERFQKLQDQYVNKFLDARWSAPGYISHENNCSGSDTEEDDLWKDDDVMEQLKLRGCQIPSFEYLRRLIPDKFGVELGVAASVLAYFQLAYARIMDVIPMLIEYNFCNRFTVDLQETLIKDLGLTDSNDGMEKCAKYAVDDPKVEARRNKLTQNLCILNNANEILDRL